MSETLPPDPHPRYAACKSLRTQAKRSAPVKGEGGSSVAGYGASPEAQDSVSAQEAIAMLRALYMEALGYSPWLSSHDVAQHLARTTLKLLMETE